MSTPKRTPVIIRSLATLFALVALAALAAGRLGAMPLSPGDILVADAAQGTVYHINPSTGAQTALVAPGSMMRPTSLDLDTNGDIVVGCSVTGVDTFYRINAATGAFAPDQLLATRIGDAPNGIAIDRTLGFIYVTHTDVLGQSVLSRFDPANPFNTPSFTRRRDVFNGIAVGSGSEVRIAGVANGSPAVFVASFSTGVVRSLTTGSPLLSPADVATDLQNDVLVADSAHFVGWGGIYEVSRPFATTTNLYQGPPYHRVVAVDIDGFGRVHGLDFAAAAVFRVASGTGAVTTVSAGGQLVEPHDLLVVPGRRWTIVTPAGRFVEQLVNARLRMLFGQVEKAGKSSLEMTMTNPGPDDESWELITDYHVLSTSAVLSDAVELEIIYDDWRVAEEREADLEMLQLVGEGADARWEPITIERDVKENRIVGKAETLGAFVVGHRYDPKGEKPGK